MGENPICEITITSRSNREWQGWIYFPASGQRREFQSLLELLREVENRLPSGEDGGWGKE